jgi:hypothetical protein
VHAAKHALYHARGMTRARRLRPQEVRTAVAAEDFARAASAKRSGAAAAAAIDVALPRLLSELRELYTKNMDLFMRM